VPVDEIPGTDGSLKLHPRETPRAAGLLSIGRGPYRPPCRRMDADVIHANSIGPVIYRPRRPDDGDPCRGARSRPAPRSTLADASLRLIATGRRVVVANSRYTAEGVRVVTGRAPV